MTHRSWAAVSTARAAPAARRRRRQGLALTESLIVLPVFFALWGILAWYGKTYNRFLDYRQQAREIAWKNASALECQGEERGGITLGRAELPPASEFSPEASVEIEDLARAGALPFLNDHFATAEPFGEAEFGEGRIGFQKAPILGGGSTETFRYNWEVSCNEPSAGMRWGCGPDDVGSCASDHALNSEGETPEFFDDSWYVFVELTRDIPGMGWELDPCREGLASGPWSCITSYCADEPAACDVLPTG